MKSKIKSVTAWAWQIDLGDGPSLCFWAAASKEQLLRQKKPSPEAKAVKVLISRYSERKK